MDTIVTGTRFRHAVIATARDGTVEAHPYTSAEAARAAYDAFLTVRHDLDLRLVEDGHVRASSAPVPSGGGRTIYYATR